MSDDGLPHHRVYEHRDTLHGLASGYLDLLDTALTALRIAEHDRDAAKAHTADLTADLRTMVEAWESRKPEAAQDPAECADELRAVIDRHVRRQHLDQMIRDGEDAGLYDDTETDQ